MTLRHELVQPRKQIVAGHGHYPPIIEADFLQNLLSLRGTADRIHPPGVRHDLQRGLITKNRRQAFKNIQKIRGEPGMRVALLLQRQDRHGQLGQIIQRQIVETALLSEQNGRIEIIPPKSAAVADPNHVTSHDLFSSCTAKAIARRQAFSNSAKSTYSPMAWMLFCPAPNVIVGMPWRTIQLASNPPLPTRKLGFRPANLAAASACRTTGASSSSRN